MILTLYLNYCINAMKLLSAIQSMLPDLHAFSDEESRFHLGCTWHGLDGLREYHDFEFKYTYNSERLALQGEPMPDGSWRYTEPCGRIHIISAARAKEFMDHTHRSASIMLDMLNKLKDAGLMDNAIDTEAQAA